MNPNPFKAILATMNPAGCSLAAEPALCVALLQLAADTMSPDPLEPGQNPVDVALNLLRPTIHPHAFLTLQKYLGSQRERFARGGN